jgi:hypothetical protein
MDRQPSEANTARDPATVETLRLAYEDRVREATRLRDARRSFTAQLGLLPASAAVIVTLLTAFSTEIGDERLLALALIPFVLVVAIGAGFSQRKPYRAMRRELEEEAGRADWRRLSQEQWLVAMIELEERIYLALEKSLEWERRGVVVVQGLVVVQIVYVIILAVV